MRRAAFLTNLISCSFLSMNQSLHFCLLPVTLMLYAPTCPSLSPVSVFLPSPILVHAFISQHCLPRLLYVCVTAPGSSTGRWGVQGMEVTHQTPLAILLKDFSVRGPQAASHCESHLLCCLFPSSTCPFPQSPCQSRGSSLLFSLMLFHCGEFTSFFKSCLEAKVGGAVVGYAPLCLEIREVLRVLLFCCSRCPILSP